MGLFSSYRDQIEIPTGYTVQTCISDSLNAMDLIPLPFFMLGLILGWASFWLIAYSIDYRALKYWIIRFMRSRRG